MPVLRAAIMGYARRPTLEVRIVLAAVKTSMSEDKPRNDAVKGLIGLMCSGEASLSCIPPLAAMLRTETASGLARP